jgi:hypothetical protein
MLPVQTIDTQYQWHSYQQVQGVVDQIRVGQTLDDLRTIGLDVDKTPNIEVLTYIEIAHRFGLIGLRDNSVTIPEGVKKLMLAAEKGKGYEMTVESTTHQRVGSFWADFFQFRKKIHVTGWKYSVLLIVVDDKVQYVLSKGSPNIDKFEKHKNPLGPFQRINGYILIDLATDLK